jgi:hypothetical protein
MTREEPGGEAPVTGTVPPVRTNSSLPAAGQSDIVVAADAGKRLVASADPDAVPLPVVRLPSPLDDGERW